MPMERRPSPAELERLGLYDPNGPDPEDQLRLLKGAFDLGATLDEVIRAVRHRYNLGPLMLDLIMRPAGPTEDLGDFAASEPEPLLVRRLWSALGLPDSDGSSVRVTPDAAEALRVMTRMVDLFGEEATLAVARVVGSSMARLAETISDTFRVSVEMPGLNNGKSRAEVAEDYTLAVRDLLPAFLGAVEAVFRRHLVNVSFQTWSTDTDQAAVILERTVCFADLVGSTETLRAVSIREMANLLRSFEEQVWDLVGAGGGRVVKLIGDEAMFVLEDPSAACQVGLDLIRLSERPVRIGMAHGMVVGLYGDYFGETANLAARLVDLADASTLVVSESVRDRASVDATFVRLASRALKGFADPVPMYRVDPRPQT
jgi:class 3 adenylate cyclase